MAPSLPFAVMVVTEFRSSSPIYRTGPASWSRFVRRRLRCPPIAAGGIRQLAVEFGRTQPGLVLYPTSDETAWIFGQHHDDLSHAFACPAERLGHLLAVEQAAARSGRTRGESTFRVLVPEADGDLRNRSLAKRAFRCSSSRSRRFCTSRTPGRSRATRRAQAAVRGDVAAVGAPAIVKHDPTVVRPIVQEFQVEATRGIYSLSGFINESGGCWAFARRRKCCSGRGETGVGLCFEHADVNAELVQAVVRISRRVGYFGAFEVEFIRVGDKHLLIDFNPRFYGQMGFDIARDFPVPMFAYAAALGDREMMTRLSRERSPASDTGQRVYCHRMELEVFLRAQRLAGGLTAQETRYWRQWARGRRVDAVIDPQDRLPIAAEVIRHVLEHLRHPRVFLRTMMAKSLFLSVDFLTCPMIS